MDKLTEPRVGTIAILKVPCLENDAGTSGVCYDVYTIGDRKGYAFIFENGKYDGFAPDEVGSFLLVIDHFGTSDEMPWSYKFENVMKLSKDFENGSFLAPFSEAEILKEGYRLSK